METYVIGEEGASWAKGGTRLTELQARAAAFSFTLTGLLGYTLDRCVFSFPTVQFKKQLIVWSLYFWFGALMMRVTGISIPLWSMVLSKSDSLAALQLRRNWAGTAGVGTEVSSQYSGSKSVTSTAGDTKAIAGTNDGRWRWWRQALGAGPGVQLSPPGLGSARLRTAEEGGQATRGGREGQVRADRSAPRPRGDPRAETQQGPTRAPARPERLKTEAGERAWKEAAAAAKRASREGGRSASPGASKAATAERARRKAGRGRERACEQEGRPGLALRGSRGSAVAAGDWAAGASGPPECGRAVRTGAAGRQVAGGGRGPGRASARNCCCEEGRVPGKPEDPRRKCVTLAARPFARPGQPRPRGLLGVWVAGAGARSPWDATTGVAGAGVPRLPNNPRKWRKCSGPRAGSANLIISSPSWCCVKRGLPFSSVSAVCATVPRRVVVSSCRELRLRPELRSALRSSRESFSEPGLEEPRLPAPLHE